MRQCQTWLAFGLAAFLAGAFPAVAAVVYKWIDADGVVHFSDQPVPGAEKIMTTGGSSRGILTEPAPAESAARRSAEEADTLIRCHRGVDHLARRRVKPSRERRSWPRICRCNPRSSPTHPLSIRWTLNGSPVSEAAGCHQLHVAGSAPGRVHAVGHRDRSRNRGIEERRFRDLQRAAPEPARSPAQVALSRPGCEPLGR